MNTTTRRTVADIFGLDGRIAVVTGGASGIGEGITRMLADAGATVIIADRDQENAARVVRDLGGKAAAVGLELVDEDSVIASFEQIAREHGAPWALVNCAGAQGRMVLAETTIADWDYFSTINLRGSFLCLREAAKAMVAGGKGGRIVNISSVSAITPMMLGLTAYAASKAGVLGLTQNAALELAPHGITVNAVLPGGVDTPGGRASPGLVAPGRAAQASVLGWCTPDDIAAAVLYLTSPQAGRISGQSIPVDAGFLLG